VKEEIINYNLSFDEISKSEGEYLYLDIAAIRYKTILNAYGKYITFSIFYPKCVIYGTDKPLQLNFASGSERKYKRVKNEFNITEVSQFTLEKF
jgi:hypothetical protein